MNELNIRSAARSDTGCIREHNEDAFLQDDSQRLYAIADGLGGLPEGERASRMAVERLASLVDKREGSLLEAVDAAFPIINLEIHEYGTRHHADTGIGTTLTCGLIVDSKVELFHVGDSVAILLRESDATVLTRDHTMAAEFQDQMPTDRYGNVPEYFYHTLTRCMGQMNTVEVARSTFRLFAGDRLVFCSDGLTRVMEPEEMRPYLIKRDNPEDAVDRLVELGLERGAPDNLTAIVVFID